MGTDIHLYVERRAPGGAWESADVFVVEGADTDHSYTTVEASYYSSRSYDTFAILADVRNGSGFAGVKTGQGFEPISEPRGFPDDISQTLREHLVDGGGGGDHSASWLTLAEIQAYDWTRTSTKTGLVDLREWARYKMLGKPQEWCGSVGGPLVVQVTSDQVEAARGAANLRDVMWDEPTQVRLARTLGATSPDRLYVRVDWTVRYYEAAAEFLSTCVPRLWRLGAPEDVRVVFNFDS